MPSELELAKEQLIKAKELAAKATQGAAVAERVFQLMEERQTVLGQLERIDGELAELNRASIPLIRFDKPVLALPRLLPDHSDVDPACREHLDLQTQQVTEIFRKLSSPDRPLIESKIIKKYILDNYVIETPEYWLAKTAPKEPERWWKHMYDKVIERLDLVEHLIARADTTGKKGRYALVEYLNQKEDRLF